MSPDLLAASGSLRREPSAAADSQRSERLEQAIKHAAHLLPSQAPIRVFIHHNTLHAFEDLPFHTAVQQGGAVYGCQPYLSEDRYRAELERGRILPHDLAATLIDDLGEDGDRLISFLATRYHLRLAMLQYPLRVGTEHELRWLIAEANAVREFLPETPSTVREQLVDETRRWVMRDLRNGSAAASDPRVRQATAALFELYGKSQIEHWSAETWSAFTLHLLWYVCHAGVHGVPRFAQPTRPPIRHRDLLLDATSVDIDQPINEVLIRFLAAYLDQGIADWTLPQRDRGLFSCWMELYRDSHPVPPWMHALPEELLRIESYGISPQQLIAESLDALGVGDAEAEEYLAQTMLALPGWTGMIWQLETNAEWTVHPAPPGSLIEYVSVRLLLERLALTYFARQTLGHHGELRGLRDQLRHLIPREERVNVDLRAFTVFQIAQHLGWKPFDLYRLSKSEWSNLVEEIESFSSIQRRRIYHLAFERRFRTQILDAMIVQSRHAAPPLNLPAFQLICCLDEREESFRRHLEEVAPNCETFGAAGFFGVAMYYRGLADAHYVPLCPIVVKPQHYVQEEAVLTYDAANRRAAENRRKLGLASHRLHTHSRSAFGGAVAAIFGPLASIPLVARVLFPRLTARVRRTFGRFVQPTGVTRLAMERQAETPGPEEGRLGYSLKEMTDIGERILRDMGLTRRFARLILVTGHGSSSINNPHESAYDCGACGGGRGGPNARALAGILNDPRIRQALAERGIHIPAECVVIGAQHNTCDDSVTFFDIDRLPASHKPDFDSARRAINIARQRNAHERCRRFESAELSITPEAALRHVEGRSEDLSQVRPELGHATNAVCYVGRRSRLRGLFLDRRTFLVSYDPSQDDEACAILTRILQAVIPVCAGINLEYFFSYVDSPGYGCGSKLPHNITSLIGVMDGAASDLRPGLPWQMVEIHEPVRLLFVIETTPEKMLRILDRNPPLKQLVFNGWVQLSVIDSGSAEVHLLRDGQFEPYAPETTELPVVDRSVDWYRGWRNHLGCARIRPGGTLVGNVALPERT